MIKVASSPTNAPRLKVGTESCKADKHRADDVGGRLEAEQRLACPVESRLLASLDATDEQGVPFAYIRRD
jgi:hypothetical protein